MSLLDQRFLCHVQAAAALAGMCPIFGTSSLPRLETKDTELIKILVSLDAKWLCAKSAYRGHTHKYAVAH